MTEIDVNVVVQKLRDKIGTLVYELAVAEAVADFWQKEASKNALAVKLMADKEELELN
jgi:hypothetical protein